MFTYRLRPLVTEAVQIPQSHAHSSDLRAFAMRHSLSFVWLHRVQEATVSFSGDFTGLARPGEWLVRGPEAFPDHEDGFDQGWTVIEDAVFRAMFEELPDEQPADSFADCCAPGDSRD